MVKVELQFSMDEMKEYLQARGYIQYTIMTKMGMSKVDMETSIYLHKDEATPKKFSDLSIMETTAVLSKHGISKIFSRMMSEKLLNS